MTIPARCSFAASLVRRQVSNGSLSLAGRTTLSGFHVCSGTPLRCQLSFAERMRRLSQSRKEESTGHEISSLRVSLLFEPKCPRPPRHPGGNQEGASLTEKVLRRLQSRYRISAVPRDPRCTGNHER